MNWYKNWYSRGNAKAPGHPWGLIVCLKSGGAEGIRTLDPLLAKQVLSQLSYSPTYLERENNCNRLDAHYGSLPFDKPHVSITPSM